MTAPKKPQDHKPKISDAVEVMGIKLTVPADRLSDWDIAEGIATLQDDAAEQSAKLVASVRVARGVMGEDYERVKKELRAKNGGTLSGDDIADFLKGLFEALNPNS